MWRRTTLNQFGDGEGKNRKLAEIGIGPSVRGRSGPTNWASAFSEIWLPNCSPLNARISDGRAHSGRGSLCDQCDRDGFDANHILPDRGDLPAGQTDGFRRWSKLYYHCLADLLPGSD